VDSLHGPPLRAGVFQLPNQFCHSEWQFWLRDTFVLQSAACHTLTHCLLGPPEPSSPPSAPPSPHDCLTYTTVFRPHSSPARPSQHPHLPFVGPSGRLSNHGDSHGLHCPRFLPPPLVLFSPHWAAGLPPKQAPFFFLTTSGAFSLPPFIQSPPMVSPLLKDHNPSFIFMRVVR
jgi:hypothetical protein